MIVSVKFKILANLIIAILVALVGRFLCLLQGLVHRDDIGHPQELHLVGFDHVQDVADSERV